MHDRGAAERNCDGWEYQKSFKCYNPCPPRSTYCPPRSPQSQLCNFVPQCTPLRQCSTNRPTSPPPYRFATQLIDIPAPCPGKRWKTSRTNMKGYPNKVPLYLVPVVYVPEKIIVKSSQLMAHCQRKPLSNQSQIPCLSRSQVCRGMRTYENQRRCPQTRSGKSREKLMNECQNTRPKTYPSLSRGRNPPCPSWSQERVPNAHQNPKPCPRTCPSLSRERGINTYQNPKQYPRTCPSWQTKPCPSESRETRSGVLCNVKSLSDFSSIIISQVDGSNSIVFKRSLNGSSKKSISSSHISLGNLMLSCSRSFPSRRFSQQSTRLRNTKATCLSATSFRTYDKEKSRELLGKSHSTLTATCLCPKETESSKELKEIKSILTAKSIKRPNFDSEELIIKSNDKSCKDLKVTITTEYVGAKVRKPDTSRSRDKFERKKSIKYTVTSENSKEKKSEGTSALMKLECVCPVDKVDRKDKPVRKPSKEQGKKVRRKTSNEKTLTSKNDAKKVISNTSEIKDEGRSLRNENSGKSSSQKKVNAIKSKGQKKATSGIKSKISKASKESNTTQNKSSRTLSSIKLHELHCDENCDYDCKYTQTQIKKIKTEPVDIYSGRQFGRKTPLERSFLGNTVQESYCDDDKSKRKCFCSPSRKRRFKPTKEPPLYLSQTYY